MSNNDNYSDSIYDYPNHVQPYADIQPPVVMLDGPYIGDQLKEAQKNWTKEKAVILNCPTGCGNTQFVLSDCIRRYHAHENAKILIVANRRPLLYSYRNEVAKITGEDKFFTKEGFATYEQFKNIYVVSYQGLQSFLNKNDGIHFNIVIFDEIHFLLNDSEFSNCTGAVLNLIPKRFYDSIRIYMSATIDLVLPYIIKMELEKDCFYAKSGGLIFNDTMRPILVRYTHIPTYAFNNPSKQYFDERVPIPTIYRIRQDYSNIKLSFFDDENNLLKTLQKSKNKSIIFVDSKNKGKDMKEILGKDVAMYLDAETAANDTKLLAELVDKESFEGKYLITTSVFCNGNNIKDPGVKNVVIYATDPVDILQMCGRRRLVGEKDGFAL